MDILKLKEAPHWSVSAMDCFRTCPLKYQFRYIEQAPTERVGVCFALGRAVHAALSERALKGKVFNHKDAKDFFDAMFEVEVKASENLIYKPNETFDSVLETGERMVEAVLDEWQDDYSVESVAESFSIEVPGLSMPLIGELDMVVTDGADRCIVDFKTSASKWPQGKADLSLQASAYSFAYKQIHNINPLFRFTVVTKAKAPTVSNYYTLRVQDELDRFVYLANQIEQSVKAGVFYPNENIMNCGDCPYRDRCKKIHWKEKKS